ncbi:geranylgeranylglycerol-phosphate geranylgeranyltransferase [Pyrococcus furiosus DSM 3638]|uniref:Digeranylgeranylglyceryl phosphate synthase n=3 Tax=Pyrococcus furiosus TaxID=2261 RepID=DGGGP_PYRFU|nr:MULTISPECIES: geranylgeranylglycerol-phosphate geranylgeranyltransferase [Pyrococcus]Q8TZM7.1 RecName: Full=Digeranylgeranylglyceryl phosphate synthase; Short=DGGGP synthase; Short=DGGGPS; AltName: Full=(S)-2,3-di-O-geranylgeranylglyceryl phosphate synthase; AltName: Full=Geranylgeranylglycerol-phosphate geranylgeranyltransferase [Pyrococcus furiosus DSM 3638]AAL82087.1 4-hydroxybenzoate octaprenyltransferase, putative [Pyrococcus furiosus DSM 3638]AFN04678.1 prenyltransferase UbiA-like prote
MEVKGFIEIMRPHNCILAGIVGILGALVAYEGIPDIKTLTLIFWVVYFGCSGGNTANDYFDYEIDKINRPNRPLPRGAMSRRAALYYALLQYAIGSILAYFLNIRAFVFATIAYFLTFLYGWKLKPLPLVGNITVAALTAATPIYGAIGVGRIGLAGYLAICAFLVNVSREIMKDIEDIEGDKALGARTLPIIIGEKKAAIIAAIFGFLTVIASFLPVKVGIGLGYAPIIIVDIIIIKASIDVLRDPKAASKGQKLLKIATFVAVISFLAGALTKGV